MTSRTNSAEAGLDRRAIRFRWGVCATAALILGASFAYAPWVSGGPVLCGSRLFFGIPCPACGLTRSFCAMTHGAFGEAFGFHLFGPLLFTLTALAIPVSILELRRGRRFEWLARIAFSPRVAWVFASLFVSYHITRLVLEARSGELAISMSHSVCATAWRALLGPPAGLL